MFYILSTLVLLFIAYTYFKNKNKSDRRAFISAITIQYPKHKITTEMEKNVCLHLLDEFKHPELKDFVNKIYNERRGIDYKYLSIPSWDIFNGEKFDNPEDDIYIKNKWNPTVHDRSRAYEKHSYLLALSSAKDVLNKWKGDPSTITDIIGVSTSGWIEPGMCSRLIKGLNLSPHCRKQELLFNGCFAGVTGLRLASNLVMADPSRVVLVVAVEVPSVHLNPQTESKNDLVANALFADGSGSAIISNKGPWEMVDFNTYTVPDTTDKMQWHEGRTNGFNGYEIYLDPKVPELIQGALLGKFGKKFLQKYAINCGLDFNPALAIHPGGRKILDFIDEGLKKLKFRGNLNASYESLRNGGNMATCSIFSIINKLWEAENNNMIVLGLGPGITIEYGFLRKNKIM